MYSNSKGIINYTSNNQLKSFFIENRLQDGVDESVYQIEDTPPNEGCFIATAAYGSYFSKHVKVLRDFRDNVLLTNSIGREFVRLYYKYSPPIAYAISKSEIEKAIVRVVLTPIVYFIKYPAFLILILFIWNVFRNRQKLAILK